MSPRHERDLRIFLDRVHPEDVASVDQQWQAALAGEPYDIQHRLLVDGQIKWVRGKATLTFDEQGQAVSAIGFTQDITESILEEQLQTSLLHLIECSSSHSIKELLEDFLGQAEVLTGSTIGFYHFVDEDTKTLSLQAWSRSTVKNFCTAKFDNQHYPISQAGVWADSLRLRQPVIHNDYASLMHKNGLPEGHAAIKRELVVPVFREDRIVAILGVGNKASDYTEGDTRIVQKLADLAWEIIVRKQAEEALKESEERFQKLFRKHDAIMLLIEPNSGQIIDANNAAVKFYGYPLEQFKKISILDINTLSEEELALERQKACAMQKNCFEFRHRLSTEEIRHVEVHASPIQLNKQTLLFSIIHDISQRKRLMEEQSRSAQLAALGTVAAGVAHEINNPIQGIMNYASLIKTRPENIERNLEIAQRIIDESKRIAKITQDLLYYSKDSRLDMRPVDLKETIVGALSLISTKVRNEANDIETRIQEELPKFLLQPQSIQQVIINLVDNASDALRYKPVTAGRKEILVSASLLKSDTKQEICIEVQDNGTGMSEEVARRSQEAFFTTKPPSEGTGLGLSIVNDIVKKHNGYIEIDSKEGQYTKMKVFLPAITEP